MNKKARRSINEDSRISGLGFRIPVLESSGAQGATDVYIYTYTHIDTS